MRVGDQRRRRRAGPPGSSRSRPACAVQPNGMAGREPGPELGVGDLVLEVARGRAPAMASIDGSPATKAVVRSNRSCSSLAVAGRGVGSVGERLLLLGACTARPCGAGSTARCAGTRRRARSARRWPARPGWRWRRCRSTATRRPVEVVVVVPAGRVEHGARRSRRGRGSSGIDGVWNMPMADTRTAASCSSPCRSRRRQHASSSNQVAATTSVPVRTLRRTSKRS